MFITIKQLVTIASITTTLSAAALPLNKPALSPTNSNSNTKPNTISPTTNNKTPQWHLMDCRLNYIYASSGWSTIGYWPATTTTTEHTSTERRSSSHSNDNISDDNNQTLPLFTADVSHDYNNPNGGYIVWDDNKIHPFTVSTPNGLNIARLETLVDGGGSSTTSNVGVGEEEGGEKGYLQADNGERWECRKDDGRVLYTVDTLVGGYRCVSQYLCA